MNSLGTSPFFANIPSAEKKTPAFSILGSALHSPLLCEHELANQFQSKGLEVAGQLPAIDEPAQELGSVALAKRLLPDNEGWCAVAGL
jgi:hypothetical protein